MRTRHKLNLISPLLCLIFRIRVRRKSGYFFETAMDKITHHIKRYEAMEATLYATEHKYFGWLFASDSPYKIYPELQKIDKARITPFGRRSMEVLESLHTTGQMTCDMLIPAIFRMKRDAFYNAWLFKCFKASCVYVSNPPTMTEKKEMGIT